ncbi:MAG: HAD family hydrolase [Candidatus Hodarchaeales archaeon]|jgi:FMN phosphatase YigB (HAD superfamily)
MDTLILDLHGVLVNTPLMTQNYEFFLTNLYSKFNISEENAKKYHNNGLEFFLSSVKKLAKENLANEPFIKKMEKIDKDWDELMRKPVKEKNIKAVSMIESRYIEEQAGKVRNVLYSDAQNFLELWEEKYFNDFSLIIASNSHRAHIMGVIKGFKEKFLQKISVYGWETLACLKSHPQYFIKLKSIINSEIDDNGCLIMIGNSTNEIIGSSNANFYPILIERDRTVSIQAKKMANKIFPSLDGVWNYLNQRFVKNDIDRKNQ